MTRQEYEEFCEALKKDYDNRTTTISREYYEDTDATVITFTIRGKQTPYR